MKGRGRVPVGVERVRQSAEEVKEVVGVLAGGVETDDEVDGAVALGDALEALSEEGVSGGGLGEL